jgi:hypothetical protein
MHGWNWPNRSPSCWSCQQGLRVKLPFLPLPHCFWTCIAQWHTVVLCIPRALALSHEVMAGPSCHPSSDSRGQQNSQVSEVCLKYLHSASPSICGLLRCHRLSPSCRVEVPDGVKRPGPCTATKEKRIKGGNQFSQRLQSCSASLGPA